ncbi:MAG: hypothetical protein WC523_03395 [Patescibacteria group bacterium]|jgi:hypothetical protein
MNDDPIYAVYNGTEIVIPMERTSWDKKRRCVKMAPQVLEQHSNVPPEIFLKDQRLSFPEDKKEEILQKIILQLSDVPLKRCLPTCCRLLTND